MSEMRSRVDPRLAELPPEFQKIVRTSRYYHRLSGAGNPIVYHSEALVEDLSTLAVQANASSPTGILTALENPVAATREAARGALRLLGWKRAASALLRRFEFVEDERDDLAWVLGRLDSQLARKQLVRWMLTHPDSALRWSAAHALLRDSHPSTAGAFQSVIDDDREEMENRLIAMEGLGNVLDRVCLKEDPARGRKRYDGRRSRFWRHYTDFLLPFLHHPTWEFRWEAAWALGLAGCRKALPILKRMAEDGHEERPGYDSLDYIMEMIG